jgi:histidinol phosphatase-like enzyme (inositol monophosphatase family)
VSLPTSTHDALDQRLQLARDAAREAGDVTLRHFQDRGLEVERKSDRSPVTIADRQAEQHLRRRIEAAFPDDAIVGEEFGERGGDSGWRWILDPIDGTKSFICGVPLYGTLVGVEHEGQSRIGVIHIPALGECVYAAEGRGAWYVKGNAEPVAARVSNCDSLAIGVFLTSQLDGFARRGAEPAYKQLEATAYITRTWGDCYGYLLVATGRAEVMIDPDMHLWDIAALLPVLREAGGTLTDWNGTTTIHSGEAIATNGRLLDEVLAVIRPYAQRR